LINKQTQSFMLRKTTRTKKLRKLVVGIIFVRKLFQIVQVQNWWWTSGQLAYGKSILRDENLQGQNEREVLTHKSIEPWEN